MTRLRSASIVFVLALGALAAMAPASASAAPRPVLVVGDSLSAAHNIPRDAGWVSLLEDRLDEVMATAPDVINASISGETSAGGLTRLPALLEQHAPGVVVIELGGNDALRGLPPAQLRANLDRMIRLSREAGAKVLLLGIEIPPNYGPAYAQRLREVYAGLAAEHEAALLPFLLEGVALQPGLMQADGIHPTAEAQPRVLDNVWPLLAPLVGASPAP
jgi:acyl-CoA thioesterase-1